jgi:hypothetical protein
MVLAPPMKKVGPRGLEFPPPGSADGMMPRINGSVIVWNTITTNLCILDARLMSIAVHPYTKEYDGLRLRFLEDLMRSIRGCMDT